MVKMARWKVSKQSKGLTKPLKLCQREQYVTSHIIEEDSEHMHLTVHCTSSYKHRKVFGMW